MIAVAELIIMVLMILMMMFLLAMMSLMVMMCGSTDYDNMVLMARSKLILIQLFFS